MREKDIETTTEDKEIQLDYISIKKKLNEVRTQKKLTQKQLSKIAGVQQGRISTCLNEENSDFFTFEQMYRICSALDLSMDNLTGLKTKNSDLTPVDFAMMLASFSKQDTSGIRFKKITVKEHVCPVNEDLGITGLDTNEYYAFYFSNHGMNNTNPGMNYFAICVNHFVEKFIKFNKLLQDYVIDSEEYETLLDNALRKLSSEYKEYIDEL